MNIIVGGSCEKHDFVLTLALMLGIYKDESVMIVTDNDRNYRYFNGEVSGVKIATMGSPNPCGITIYDWQYGIPADVQDDPKVIFVTSFEKQSLDHIDELLKIKTPDALLVLEADCGINFRYIEKSVPTTAPTYSYFDEPKRRIDWVHNGRVELKGLDKDYSHTVGQILTEILELPAKDIKKLWAYAKKRGVISC